MCQARERTGAKNDIKKTPKKSFCRSTAALAYFMRTQSNSTFNQMLSLPFQSVCYIVSGSRSEMGNDDTKIQLDTKPPPSVSPHVCVNMHLGLSGAWTYSLARWAWRTIIACCALQHTRNHYQLILRWTHALYPVIITAYCDSRAL